MEYLKTKQKQQTTTDTNNNYRIMTIAVYY